MRQTTLFAAGVLCAVFAGAAMADSPDGEAQSRQIYKELIETDTALSNGSCTLAAERMSARLKAAGFADAELHPFAAPDHPKEGGLVVVYGRDLKKKAILLLAHIDVVEAKREDWSRDPFFPGVPVVPILQPGATDGQFTTASGIPTYGIGALFLGPDLGHIHGLNEYVNVKSLLGSRDFLFRLVKIYADQN